MRAKNVILCRQPFDLFQNCGFLLIFINFHWFSDRFLTKMSWFFLNIRPKIANKNRRKNKNFTFLMQNSESTWKIGPGNTSKHYTTIIFIYIFLHKKSEKKKKSLEPQILEFHEISRFSMIWRSRGVPTSPPQNQWKSTILK